MSVGISEQDILDRDERIAELERERDELRAALGKIALLDEYDGPVVAGSYVDIARAALKAPR